MRKSNITRLSLDDIKEMKARGEIRHNPDAPEGESLGVDFWAKARIVEPVRNRRPPAVPAPAHIP